MPLGGACWLVGLLGVVELVLAVLELRLGVVGLPEVLGVLGVLGVAFELSEVLALELGVACWLVFADVLVEAGAEP